jgi:zinc protease
MSASLVHLRARRIEGAPLFALRVVLPGGARRESTPGEALVAGRMLAEGTSRRDWRQLAEAAEARGMSVSGFAGLEGHGVAVDALAADWREAVELAAELLFESAFPEDRLRWVARQAAAELEAQADQADLLTARAFAALLYAPHPKGRPLQGDPESLARLGGGDCRRYHEEALARGGFVVAAGVIDAEAVARELERRFAALGPPRDDSFTPPAPPRPEARRRELHTHARDQAHLFIGQLTVGRKHADFTALEIGGVTLGAGAGLSGRIPHRLRDREGLAYHAFADAVGGAGLDAGRFAAYIGTAPENLERAELGIREEMTRLLADGLEEQEVDEARSYLIGREPFRRETARQWAELAAQGAILGLPIEDERWNRERFERTDRAAVEAALRRHLDVTTLAVVTGLPAA